MTQHPAHERSHHTEPAAGKLHEMIYERDPELLVKAASDRRMTEELALTMLERRDLPHLAIEKLSKNVVAMKHRKVLNAIVKHPRTPRHVSLPIARRLFVFELMHIALTPTVAADLKMFAEEVLNSRLDSISSGERLALAKRGSSGIAAALLHDPELRIIEAALNSAYMTEMHVVKALMREECSQQLIDAVCHHSKWNLRREVRAALLRNEKTPLARAVALAEDMSSMALREVLRTSRLPRNVKSYLERMLEERPKGMKTRATPA
ncbi:MAG TPA: hypothetical protein VGR50_07915 [Terriglobales bacterium]|nr:hypothetical protein [Terriglobales bacterium]